MPAPIAIFFQAFMIRVTVWVIYLRRRPTLAASGTCARWPADSARMTDTCPLLRSWRRESSRSGYRSRRSGRDPIDVWEVIVTAPGRSNYSPTAKGFGSHLKHWWWPSLNCTSTQALRHPDRSRLSGEERDLPQNRARGSHCRLPVDLIRRRATRGHPSASNQPAVAGLVCSRSTT
jgi:hypothetical protein